MFDPNSESDFLHRPGDLRRTIAPMRTLGVLIDTSISVRIGYTIEGQQQQYKLNQGSNATISVYAIAPQIWSRCSTMTSKSL